MTRVTLTQVEVASIQEYIFGSNNLQQNIGASELVKRATTQWVLEACDQAGLKHNAQWNTAEDALEFVQGAEASDDPQARWQVSNSQADVEVIYAGGGNALLLFDGPKSGAVKTFTRLLSQKVIQEARDLRLLVNSTEFDWETEAASERHGQLRRDAALRKLAYAPNTPSGGLAITAQCVFTSQPVVGRDPDGRPVGRSVLDKLEKTQPGKERLHAILPQARQYFYEFVDDFDLFGEKGESSYLAVVHIDGNQMGERFREIAAAHLLPTNNRTYLDQLYRLSRTIQSCSTQALRKTVDVLITSPRDGKYGEILPAPARSGQAYLPFRPIVFGGDDITFVCEGRLGLALAVIYLKTLASEMLPGKQASDQGDPLYARAGLAVVKSHFPFSRAYELSEALCRSAKEALKERVPGQKGCTLDWHFSTTGVVASLEEIRAQEYAAEDGNSLLMRPLWVPPPGRQSSQYWQTWDNFERSAQEMLQSEAWVGHRNKLKALRDALRGGPDAVSLFLQTYHQPPLPVIPGQDQMAAKGWQNKKCAYFDVVEALDFYIPLQEPGGDQ